MKIKSAESFRRYIWKKPYGGNKEKSIDYNFIGSYATIGDEAKHGFFRMYHGIKPDIAGYLPSILKIAEDGQAIYEFLQNAVDCNSTHFYIFYNEKYFLAINNGQPFNIDGVQSLLNIAQTTKKDPDSIGRFGIGFKLAHRLVGKNEGTDELVNQYKGPVLYSWSKFEDLEKLIKNEEIEPISLEDDNEDDFFDAPYLMKLILTNFPAGPNEKVRDLKYQENVLFSQEELNELISFLNVSIDKHSENFDLSSLNHGSLFFIKLGEGKSELLDKDYSELVNGIQYSMNTLKNLEKVYINSEHITKSALILEEGTIPQDSEAFERISPEYKDFDIKYAIGFNDIKFGEKDSYELLTALREQPNFYKYFPMGDEVNKLGFIIHCDSFSNEANRRKLQHDNINKNLFPEIADFVIGRLNDYKETDRERYLSLYAAILASDTPERENNKWLRPIFFDRLLQFIKTNIPTADNGFSNVSQNVKVNNLKLNLKLSEFGLENIQWFEWSDENDTYLIDAAINHQDKLGIEKWDIRDIVEKSDLDSINTWIERCDDYDYESFLKELEKSELRQDTKKRIFDLRLFKFSDNKFYSYNQLIKYSYSSYKRVHFADYTSNIIMLDNKTFNIKLELEKLGLITTELNISNYPKISTSFSMPSESILFDMIADKCKENILDPEDKRRVFFNLVNEHTRFAEIGDASIRKLNLFMNQQGVLMPLGELIDCHLDTPSWLSKYKIKGEESFAELKKHLISANDIYDKVVIPNWGDIIESVSDIDGLYKKVVYYFGLKDSNPEFKNENFVYTEDGFLPPNQVFFNSEMINLNNGYKYFQYAIKSLFDLPTPDKLITPYLLKAPFRFDGSKFMGRNKNDVNLDVDEIKAILTFCNLNNEYFFNYYIILCDNDGFRLLNKTADIYQISSPDGEARRFIDKHCSEHLYVLPSDFIDFKNEEGIVRAEELHTLIIDCIDADEYKEMLVDIVKYKAKYELLSKLSEFRFNIEEKYTKENYEYKILELACAELKEGDYTDFQEKVKIITINETLSLSDIPPNADKVILNDVELSLSEILPDYYQNSDLLSNLLISFIDLGLSKDKMYSLFGLESQVEPEKIYELLSEKYTLLQNAQQLAFLILYSSHIEEVDFSDFNVLNIDDDEVSLQNSKYIYSFEFIDSSETLHSKYVGVAEFFKEYPIRMDTDGELLLIREPYIVEGEFQCTHLISDLLDSQKCSLIYYIYSLWLGELRGNVRNINWSKINYNNTDDLLGFNPIYSVFPSKFAYTDENLPEYLVEWLEDDSSKIDFLEDLGVWVENSVIVELRKYLSDEINNFANNSLSQENRFNDEDKMLFNTFEWLKESRIKLITERQYKVFEKIVEVVNYSRSRGDLLINKEFDLEQIEESSSEWDAELYLDWKDRNESEFSIKLYPGELPKNVLLDEIDDFVFYYFSKGNLLVDNKIIYINKDADIKKELGKLASDEDNKFTFQLLWDLYDNKTVDIAKADDLKSENYKLRKEIESLKSQLEQQQDVKIGAANNGGLGQEDQNELNREAKKVVKEKLEADGFTFTKGLNGFSTIDGVIKDNIEYPLVVKSSMSSIDPFKVGANEWLQLSKPNSMLWLHFGNGEASCIKLHDLLRKQDNLTITFSTENLACDNRLLRFAELLRYFKNVHFDFNNIKSENYSTAKDLDDYRFDVRIIESDTTSDDESLL